MRLVLFSLLLLASPLAAQQVGTNVTCILPMLTGRAGLDCETRVTSVTNPVPPSLPPRSGYGAQYSVHEEVLTVSGPGRYLGNDPDGYSIFHYDHAHLFNTFTRGGHQMWLGTMHNNGIGDATMQSLYMFSKGGCHYPGDECRVVQSLYNYEDGPHYAGTVLSTTGTGDTAPVLSGPNQGTDATFLDGGYLLLTANPLAASQLTGVSTLFQNTTLTQLATTSAIPVSTGYATLSDISVVPGLANTYTTVKGITATLRPIPGLTRPAVSSLQTGLACFVDYDHYEQAAITVTATTATTATLTAVLRYSYHQGGAFVPVLFQGGTCGTFLSSDASRKFGAYVLPHTSLTIDGMMTSYPAPGSLDGRSIITGMPNAGGWIRIPLGGDQAWTLAPGPASAFTLFHGTEVIDTGAQGRHPTLATNDIPFVAKATVSAPHANAVNLYGQSINVTKDSPSNYQSHSYNLVLAAEGHGIGGSHDMLDIVGLSPHSDYRSGGGPLVPPTVFNMATGYFNNIMNIGNAPDGFMTNIGVCNAAGVIGLYNLPNAAQGNVTQFTYNCGTQIFHLPKLNADIFTGIRVLANDVYSGAQGSGMHLSSGSLDPIGSPGYIGLMSPMTQVITRDVFSSALVAGQCVTAVAAMTDANVPGIKMVSSGAPCAGGGPQSSPRQPAANPLGGTCSMAASKTCTQRVALAYTTMPVCIATAQGSSVAGGAAACAYAGGIVTITATKNNTGVWGFMLLGNPD